MNPAIRNFLGMEQKAVRTSAGEPDLFGPDIGGFPRRFTNRNAGRHTQAYGGNDAIDWVMDCVDLYAQTASNAAFHFERDGEKLVPHKTEADDAAGTVEAPGDLVGLFEQPNAIMDYTELMELSVIDILLAGEFFWLQYKPDARGRPSSLYRISPACMEVHAGAVSPKGYTYTPPGGGEKMEIPPDQVLHVKRPNPHDPWRGLGVIAGSPTMFDLELALTEQMKNYYQQGTKLSGVLESERSIPDTTWTKIKRQFRNLYAGARNAYQVATLERGVKFRSISANAEQAEFEQISRWSQERIAAAFRVPLPLLGKVGGTDRQAVREARRIFDNSTMRPFLNRLQSMISRGLVQKGWGLDFVIEHEYVMPVEDKLDLAQVFAALPGVRVREVREYADLAPLGDERDEIVLNLPGMKREDGGHPDRPLENEPGRPPNAENTEAFPAAGDELPDSAAAQKAVEERLAGLYETLEEVRSGAA